MIRKVFAAPFIVFGWVLGALVVLDVIASTVMSAYAIGGLFGAFIAIGSIPVSTVVVWLIQYGIVGTLVSIVVIAILIGIAYGSLMIGQRIKSPAVSQVTISA